MDVDAIKRELHKKVRQRVRSLKADIAALQAELNECVSFLRDDCTHPNVIETIVTWYGEGDNDVGKHPHRFCTVCGLDEKGWFRRDGYKPSKIPEGRRLTLDEFNQMRDKAREEIFRYDD